MAESFTSADSSSPDVGSTIGRRYRVLRRIGEGGMGVVVEAENVVTGKRVAIKWMHPQVAAQPDAAERFLREARASARVRHPNVVDVYDAVHEDDTCFLVMELLEGEPLSFLLERGGVPAHELIALLLDAMRGVVAAHKQGVIHRDIKPENIFLAIESEHGPKVPKVLDFGISKLLGAGVTSLTRTGATMGTPMYMSYEQLCGVKDIDVRTDVYAFGVVLYEALTGRPPYQAANLPQLVARMTHTQPAAPRELRPEIPVALERLIQRAMAKDREARIGSLVELIEQLEPFASPRAFRPQLTAAGAALPVARAERVKQESSLLVSGRESAPVATPMEANVPIPAAPRKREALRWLIAAGVFLTVVAVLTAYGSLPPAPDDAPAAEGGEIGVAKPVGAQASQVPSPGPAAVPVESAKHDASGTKPALKPSVKPADARATAPTSASGPAKSVGTAAESNAAQAIRPAAPGAATAPNTSGAAAHPGANAAMQIAVGAPPGANAAPLSATPARTNPTTVTSKARVAAATPTSAVPGEAGSPVVTERPIARPGARPSPPTDASASIPRPAGEAIEVRPSSEPARAADASGSTRTGVVQPTAAAGAASERTAADAQREARRFRAGRPRTEEF
jgi:tRNA A-37 threonylcarbamoyl transferase component Bud32